MTTARENTALEGAPPEAEVAVVAERMVAGGSALARDTDGKISLVAGALPGERVRAVVGQRAGTLQGHVIEVLEASADRVEPPCPHVADGCGGCDWQHASYDTQPDMRIEIVRDALKRLGHLKEPVVSIEPGPADPAQRTTMALRVLGSGLGLMAERSDEVVGIDHCLIAAPELAALIAPGVIEPGDATRITLRVGSETGERMLVAEPTAKGLIAPEGVLVVGEDELTAGKRAWIHTEVAGQRFRLSAESFFQGSRAGAETLVAVARRQLADAPAGPFIDMYGGVGLFAGTVADGRQIILVERNASAVADARVNLADFDARTIVASVERWRAKKAAVVVADPARAGLKKPGVAKIVETGAARVILVSCDAASLGRDTAGLVRKGYRHVESVLVNMFPHTSHVEVVTRFDLDDGNER